MRYLLGRVDHVSESRQGPLLGVRVCLDPWPPGANDTRHGTFLCYVPYLLLGNNLGRYQGFPDILQLQPLHFKKR